MEAPWELVDTLDTLMGSPDCLSPYILDCILLQPSKAVLSAQYTATVYQLSAGFGTSMSLHASRVIVKKCAMQVAALPATFRPAL